MNLLLFVYIRGLPGFITDARGQGPSILTTLTTIYVMKTLLLSARRALSYGVIYFFDTVWDDYSFACAVLTSWFTKRFPIRPLDDSLDDYLVLFNYNIYNWISESTKSICIISCFILYHYKIIKKYFYYIDNNKKAKKCSGMLSLKHNAS